MFPGEVALDAVDLKEAAPRLQLKPLCLFLILDYADGRLLYYEHIAETIYSWTDKPTDPESIRYMAHKVRRQIPKEWPVSISCFNHFGYKMIKPRGWSWRSNNPGPNPDSPWYSTS